jgi:excisionase family DNA binding protein
MPQMPTPTDARPLLSPREVAELANVSRKTLYREVHRGALPARHVGRQLRIDRDDLARWLASDKGML